MCDDLHWPCNLAASPKHTYRRGNCAVFRKTSQAWGEYSNMAGGFPVIVNGTHILTSEALYQACRLPHLPDVQRVIIDQRSPMAAKMKSKPHRSDSRPDFDELRILVMWWTLRVKLACNFRAFSQVLLASNDLPIVEDSHKDAFWGAKALASDNDALVGQNILGQLLTNLREMVRGQTAESLCIVDPLRINDFLLLGEGIRRVSGRELTSSP